MVLWKKIFLGPLNTEGSQEKKNVSVGWVYTMENKAIRLQIQTTRNLLG